MSFAPPSHRSSSRLSAAGSHVGSVRSVRTGMSRSSSSSHLSTKRLQKLRDIQTRALLGDTLSLKLSQRSGRGLPQEVIDQEVARITDLKKETVTREDLRRLEEALKARAADLPPPTDRPSTSASIRSAVSRATSRRGSAAPTGDGEEDLDNVLPITEAKTWGAWSAAGPSLPPKPKLTPRTKAKEEWALLMKYDVMEDEEKAREKKEKQAIARAELREVLAAQLEAKQEVAKAEKEEQLVWAKAFDEDRLKSEAEEAKKVAARKERELADKLTREDQIAYRIKRKELEAKAKAKYEKKLLEQLLDESKQVEAKAAAKKEALKKKYKQIFVDNQKELEMKKARAAKEQEEDLVRMKEYARLMDEQEAKRQAEWDAFTAKQAELMKQKVAYEQQDTSGRVLMTDDKFQEQEKARLAALEEEARAKAAFKKKEMDACIAVVEEQLRMKAEVRKKEMEEGEREAAKAKILAKEFEEQESRREEERRIRNLAYKKDLETQISSRRVASTLMSDTERQLNKNKVEVAMETLRRSGIV